MTKAVMISIRPKWCELIASGRKTIEVRKTRPKIETPFKCYIYCTMDNAAYNPKNYLWKEDKTGRLREIYWNGKVIGEFVCDAIIPMSIKYSDPSSKRALKEFPYTCLTDKQIINYLGNGVDGYGWHISDLFVYDQPKELSEFCKPCKDPYRYCQECKHGLVKYPSWVETSEDLDGCCFDTECLNTLTRAPQSFMYVEAL